MAFLRAAQFFAGQYCKPLAGNTSHMVAHGPGEKSVRPAPEVGQARRFCFRALAVMCGLDALDW